MVQMRILGFLMPSVKTEYGGLVGTIESMA